METEMLVDSVNFLADNIQDVAVDSATQPAQADAVAEVLFTTHNLWIMVCTALVFLMHLGFAGVEAGFTQAKNTVNILFKNTLTPA
ncbi:MAG: ammonium transporter, partial [Bacteroidota bacterium]